MTNADKFKNIFGLYATELWSMPEKDFLKWLNSKVVNCSEIPNNWIPVSERLPKESRKYLVTVFDGIGKRTTSAPYHRRSKSWTLTGRMAYWKVTAWMPLPEPYQGGEQE